MRLSVRLTITALLLLCVTAGARSQFRYGPVVGADLTTLHWKQDLFETDKSAGYSAGLLAEMMFPGIGFGFDLGLMYEQRGATVNLGERLIWSSQGYSRERLYLHYLNIPLHLRFKWTRMDGFEDILAPYIFAGPEFGFLVAHNRCDAMSYAGGDVGIAVGVGLELMRHWQVSGSYTWGMTYALKAQQLTNMSAQNRTWNLRVAYLF